MGELASTVNVRSDRKRAKKHSNSLNLKKWTISRLLSLLRCKHLKHRFRGIFPPNLVFRTILKRGNTFMIVNASNSEQPETHWLLIAQAGGQFFFADSLGQGLHNYPHVY